MDRFIKLDKGDFIGRAAAQREFDEGPKLRRVSFVVDADNAEVMGDEPIWARVPADIETAITKPHGYGAQRFAADGAELKAPDSQVDGEWCVVGWVTSGGYGHFVQKSFAQAYIPAALADRDESGVFEIEILGRRCSAVINREALFDPSGSRMRS